MQAEASERGGEGEKRDRMAGIRCSNLTRTKIKTHIDPKPPSQGGVDGLSCRPPIPLYSPAPNSATSTCCAHTPPRPKPLLFRCGKHILQYRTVPYRPVPTSALRHSTPPPPHHVTSGTGTARQQEYQPLPSQVTRWSRAYRTSNEGTCPDQHHAIT